MSRLLRIGQFVGRVPTRVFRVPEGADVGVDRGRGLPTLCQEIFSSEEDGFFCWGLCPQTPGI
jgi:hypothetical protein